MLADCDHNHELARGHGNNPTNLGPLPGEVANRGLIFSFGGKSFVFEKVSERIPMKKILWERELAVFDVPGWEMEMLRIDHHQKMTHPNLIDQGVPTSEFGSFALKQSGRNNPGQYPGNDGTHSYPDRSQFLFPGTLGRSFFHAAGNLPLLP